MIRKIRLSFPKSGRISPIVQQVPASFRLVRQRAGAIVRPCPTAAKYLSFALLDYQINDRFVVLPQTRETGDQVVSAIAHQSNMRNHIIKIAIVSMALVGEPLANGDPEFKANDGIYVVINHVPKECKVKIDGYYQISKDRTVSLPLLKATIPFDRSRDNFREKLQRAIARYCEQEFPGRTVFPDCEIVEEAGGKHAADGVIVAGQVRKPGLIPMKEGLTGYQVVVAAGGATEFSTMRHVTILREHKVIDLDLTKAEFMKFLLKSGDTVIVPRKCLAGESEYSLH